ncbi:MAG: hypothetical protein HY914_06590 [Desulfomonile tiedjei]|nr:hypothetical protein [Desulfomonile tiedjei]
MSKSNFVLSEAAAHQELILMDSRVAGSVAESFFDRFSRREMSQYEVLARFGELLAETRVGGGRVIHLGKIVTNEILEFMESDPDVPSGMQLEAAVRSLGELAPFLAPLLMPISAEVESQGFGRLVAETSFEGVLHRKALIYFKRFANLLNVTKNLLEGGDRTSLNVVSFDEPAPFELDTSEDPFDLEDLNTVSPTTRAAVKFLIKMAGSDSEFSDAEKQLLAQVVDRFGEPISPSQWEKLVAEASREPLESILKTLEHQPMNFKENLCLSAMLLAASDRHVDVIEKKILAQALPFLRISRERYSEIAKDAVSILKTRGSSTADEPQPLGEPRANVPPSADPVAPPTNAAVPESPQHIHGRQEVQKHETRSVADRTTPQEQGISHRDSESSPRGPASAGAENTVASHDPLSPTASREGKIWRCPACHMPQFQEFEECPQCGIIVSKFREKLARQERPAEPDEFVEVQADPEESHPPHPGREEAAKSEVPAVPTCVECRLPIPPGAKYCPTCGARNV